MVFKTASKNKTKQIMSFTVLDVVIWTILSIIFIGLIMAIHGNIRLYKYRELPLLEKRNLSIIFGLNISIICAILLSIGVILSQYLNSTLSHRIVIVLQFASWFSIFLFLNIDAFCIHFRYKWQYYTIQSKWQEIINPSYVEALSKHNWYIRTYSIWGKYSNICKVFATVHVIDFMISAALEMLLRPNIDNSDHIILVFFLILESVTLMLPFIIYITIVFTTPIFDDIFLIHWQSRMEAKLSLILIIVFLSGNIVETTITNDHISTLLYTLIFNTILIIILFTLLSVSTFMIKYKDDKQAVRMQMERITTMENTRNDNTKITLDSVLGNDKCLNIFMNHLSKEYSMELLLSYIEFDQFQKYIIKTANAILQQHALGKQEDMSYSPSSRIKTKRTTLHPDEMIGPMTPSRLYLWYCENEECKFTEYGVYRNYQTPYWKSTNAAQMFVLCDGCVDEYQMDEDEEKDGSIFLVNDKRESSDHLKLEIPTIDTMNTLRNVPTSMILETSSSMRSDVAVDERTLHDAKKKAHLLYEKYIKIGSEFEINISASMRQELMDLLDDKDDLMNSDIGLADMVLLFENPKKEMKMLLSYSFTRMRLTGQYRNIVLILKGKDSPI